MSYKRAPNSLRHGAIDRLNRLDQDPAREQCFQSVNVYLPTISSTRRRSLPLPCAQIISGPELRRGRKLQGKWTRVIPILGSMGFIFAIVRSECHASRNNSGWPFSGRYARYARVGRLDEKNRQWGLSTLRGSLGRFIRDVCIDDDTTVIGAMKIAVLGKV